MILLLLWKTIGFAKEKKIQAEAQFYDKMSTNNIQVPKSTGEHVGWFYNCS